MACRRTCICNRTDNPGGDCEKHRLHFEPVSNRKTAPTIGRALSGNPRSIRQMFATLRMNFLASQSRRTKITIENSFCSGSTQINGGRMLKQRTLMSGDGESVGYTFFFQIANEGGRRACCVKVDALNIQEASALFRQNWPDIESMARNGIDKSGGGGVLTLVIR
jgi:hypothetical protein